jgi:gluconate 2-dehydrogenase gamma chain
MAEIGRRGLLKLMGAVPVAAALPLARGEEKPAPGPPGQARAKRAAFTPRFFTTPEYATVRALADMVIPRDERSGGATDALVPEFLDFILTDPMANDRERERRQTAMRGGLAWLDAECGRRFAKTFLECGEGERTRVLDDIAWPEKARPEMSHGVKFFNDFRDLTASGFWSSQMGVEDLQYQGNTVVVEWKGCPPEVLRKLGLPPDSAA